MLSHCPDELVRAVELGHMAVSTATASHRKSVRAGKEDNQGLSQTAKYTKARKALEGLTESQRTQLIGSVMSGRRASRGGAADAVTYQEALTILRPVLGVTCRTIHEAAQKAGHFLTSCGRRSDLFSRVVAFAQGHPSFDVTWRKDQFKIDHDARQQTLAQKLDQLQKLKRVHDDLGAEATMYAYYLRTQVDAWFHTVGGFEGVIVDDPDERDRTVDGLRERMNEFCDLLKECDHVRQ